MIWPRGKEIAALLACHALATIVCALLFVVAMQAGLFASISILFYRGLVALAACGIIVAIAFAFLAARWGGQFIGARDIIGATIVALALNLTAFTLGPVTVDRSISVFMLSRFDRAEHPLTADEVKADFLRVYGGEWDQIGRRLSEQEISGNLEKTPEGYRLTPQGRSFMRVARGMSRAFGADPRFVGLDQKSDQRP